MAKSDLIKTYRGAALGWSWAIIRPCVTIFTYWFTFSVGLRSGRPVNGTPFFLWLLCGLVPWFYMRDMLNVGTESFRRYKHLVTKMKFPISIIPTFVSVSKMMVSLVLIAVVCITFWLMGYPPTLYWLQIPLYVVLSFIFFTLWGQFSSLISAISSDFANLVKSFITPLFWLSGILWRSDNFEGSVWVKRFLEVNPITYLIGGFRECFIFGKWFWEDYNELLYFGCMTLILWALSLWAYKKLRKEIPDVL
jgi:teichoic acid transport system permease protein